MLFFSAFSCSCFFFVLRLHFFSCAPFFSGDGFLSLLPNYILFFCFFLFLFLACLSELTEMLQQEKFHTIERNRSYLKVLFSHFYSFHLFHCNYIFISNVQKFLLSRSSSDWELKRRTCLVDFIYNFSNNVIYFFLFWLIGTTSQAKKANRTRLPFLFHWW